MKNRKIIGFLAISAIVIAIPLTTLISQNRQITNQHASGNTCNPTGVTKNQDGTYAFAPLHVNTQGILVDPNNCEVYLLGSEGKIPLPNHAGELSITKLTDITYLDPYIHNVQMNVLRVPIMVSNWNNNVFMSDPLYPRYQDFVKAYIKAIEARGLYVEIDKFPSVTNNPQDDVTALTSMASTFSTDPAVIFDVRNEASYPYENIGSQSAQMIYNDDVSWLNAVDAGNKNAIKVVYYGNVGNMEKKIFPFYTNNNLIIDFHLYSGYYGTSPDDGLKCDEPNKAKDGKDYQYFLRSGGNVDNMIQYLRAQPNPTDFIINEWGGCEADSSYVTTMMQFAMTHHIAGLSYYYPDNWFWKDNEQEYENGNGTRTNQAYMTIFGSFGLTPTLSPTGSITNTPTPTPTFTPTPQPTCTPQPYCMTHVPYCYPHQPLGGWCNPTLQRTTTSNSQTAVHPPCTQRPACLSAHPACAIPQPIGGWCNSTTGQ